MELRKTNSTDSYELTAQQYLNFTRFLEKACGIVLGDSKQYLIVSRMKKIMAEFSFQTLDELITTLVNRAPRDLCNRVVDAMTTNETSWFRDNAPYDALKQHILPDIAKSKSSKLRIWSAACSSGQEPYSISIIGNEFQSEKPGVLRAGFEVVATDISPEMIKTATAGVYDDSAIARGVSLQRKQRYFQHDGKSWTIRPQVKANVSFRELNLTQSYALLGKFDIIFCRNVLIYFSCDSKKDIVERMAKQLNPGGYLLLGGSESMNNISDLYVMEKIGGCVLYRLKNNDG